MSVFFCQKCNKNVEINTDGNISAVFCPFCGTGIKDEITNSLINPGDMPPPDSRIEIVKTRYNTPEIYLPPESFSARYIPIIIFAVFWIGFVLVWTVLASFASILFAMFSIPFWLVGIGMLAGIARTMTEKQKLIINKSSIEISKRSVFKKQTKLIYFSDIQEIDYKDFKPKNPLQFFSNMKMGGSKQAKGTPMKLPVIVAENKKTYFFDSADDWGAAWIVDYLKYFIYEQTGKKV